MKQNGNVNCFGIYVFHEEIVHLLSDQPYFISKSFTKKGIELNQRKVHFQLYVKDIQLFALAVFFIIQDFIMLQFILTALFF